MSDTVSDLMQANLLAVFNERDPRARPDAIAAMSEKLATIAARLTWRRQDRTFTACLRYRAAAGRS